MKSMAYKILRSVVIDNGSTSAQLIDDAAEDLAQQVKKAFSDGWELAGGISTLSRQKPHGLMIWLMQAVVMSEKVMKTVERNSDLPAAPTVKIPPAPQALDAEKSRKIATAARNGLEKQ